MTTKEDLEKEIKELKTILEALEDNNKFLLDQQKELVTRLGIEGSNTANWKHQYLRLNEEYIKLKRDNKDTAK